MACCFDGESLLDRAVCEAEQQTGRHMIRIDTPIIDVADNAAARRNAENRILLSKKSGCEICMPHHSSAEQLVSRHSRTMDRLPDYLSMIREKGMIPGLSAHMPELIVFSDENEYDVQTYVQLYNCLGFLMQVEVEQVYRIIWNAKKPVMTIKSMAAGRVSPLVGLSFSYNTIRPCDMVTVGAFTPREVDEDVEIALAAIEYRQALFEGRASPNTNTAVLENKRYTNPNPKRFHGARDFRSPQGDGAKDGGGTSASSAISSGSRRGGGRKGPSHECVLGLDWY